MPQKEDVNYNSFPEQELTPDIIKTLGPEFTIDYPDGSHRTFSQAEAQARYKALGVDWDRPFQELSPGRMVPTDEIFAEAQRNPKWREKYAGGLGGSKEEKGDLKSLMRGMPPSLRALETAGGVLAGGGLETLVAREAPSIGRALGVVGEAAVNGVSSYFDPAPTAGGLIGSRGARNIPNVLNRIGEAVPALSGLSKLKLGPQAAATLESIGGAVGSQVPQGIPTDTAGAVSSGLSVGASLIPGVAAATYANRVRKDALPTEVTRGLEKLGLRPKGSMISPKGSVQQEFKHFSDTLADALAPQGTTPVNPAVARLTAETQSVNRQLFEAKTTLWRADRSVKSAERAERLAKIDGTLQQQQEMGKKVQEAKSEFASANHTDAQSKVLYEKERKRLRDMLADGVDPNSGEQIDDAALKGVRRELQDLDDSWRIEHAENQVPKVAASGIAGIESVKIPKELQKDSVEAVRSAVPVMNEAVRDLQRQKLVLAQATQNAKALKTGGYVGVDPSDIEAIEKITGAGDESAKLDQIISRGPRGFKVASQLAPNNVDELKDAILNQIVLNAKDPKGGLDYAVLADTLKTRAELMQSMFPGKNVTQIKANAEELKDILQAMPKLTGIPGKVFHYAQGRLASHALIGTSTYLMGNTFGAAAALSAGIGGEAVFLTLDGFVRNMMQNDALRRSALEWTKSRTGRLSGDAGRLFVNWLNANREPVLE